MLISQKSQDDMWVCFFCIDIIKIQVYITIGSLENNRINAKVFENKALNIGNAVKIRDGRATVIIRPGTSREP
jgi:hypothetical protein